MKNDFEMRKNSVTLSEINKIKFIAASVDSQKLNNNANTPAYLLSLDVGSELLSKHKKNKYISSAQLVSNHEENDLVGERLLVVVNFPRKQIGKFKSDCLVTGLQSESLDINERIKTTVAVKTSEPVADGSIISVSNQKGILTENARDLIFSDFKRVDIRVGTVLNLEPDKNSSTPLLRVECGSVGEKFAATGWNQVSENIIGKQILLVINVNSDDIPSESSADSLVLSPKDGVWCMPMKPCENGYRLA